MATNQPPPLVLVADDDGVSRAMVSAWLSTSGYRVINARDGDEALEISTRRRPDLLLLDVTMPKLDGYEVCRAVQTAIPLPPPVIFLTAHGQTTARVEGLDAGAVDYIVKPFDRAELIARVRAALRTKAVRDGFIEEATRDGLTGLLNRREIDARTDTAVELARRHGRPLSVLLTDIDHFKEINDRHGHAAGDEVIREVARRIVAVSRAPNIVGRYGGEEFVLLLPEASPHDAITAGDRLRDALSDHPIIYEALSIPVTASVGAASLRGDMGTKALLAAADQALYRAKALGRNRTESDQQPALAGQPPVPN